MSKPDNTGSGFQRLGDGYESAATVDDVCTWAGVPLIPGGAAIVTGPRPSNVVASAWADIEAIADFPGWLSAEAVDDMAGPDPYLRAILGCDQESAADRLKAVVARAYGEAALLAEAYAGFHEDGARAGALARTIRSAAERLGSAMSESVELLNKRRVEGADRKEDRSSDSQYVRDAIEKLSSNLEGYRDQATGAGRRADVPRRFLVTRLAEVFALLTGEAPAFHATGWADQENGKGSPWERFLSASIWAVKLPTGMDGMNDLLKKIRSDFPDDRDQIVHFAKIARRQRSLSKKPADRLSVEFGALGSAGMLTEYGVAMPWDRDPPWGAFGG